MNIFTLVGKVLLDGAKESEDALAELDEQGKKTDSGLSKAFKNIGKAAVVGAAAIGAGLGAALVTGTRDAIEAEEKVAQLEAVLKSTNSAAGMTKEALLGMAQGFEETTKFSAESVIEAQSLLLTFTKIGSDVFPRATQAAADMATAMGTDMAGQSIALGKALNDPVAGVASLTRVGVQFTEEQKNAIAAMVEMGDIAGAQGIILGELETQFGGSAEAAGKTFGGQLEILKNAFGGVKEELALQFMPVLERLMTWTMENMPEIKRVFQNVFDAVSIAVSVIYDWFSVYLLPIIKDVYTFIVDNWDTISLVFGTVFEAIGVTIGIAVDIISGLWDMLKDGYKWISETFVKVKDVFEDIFEGISTAIEESIGWITDFMDKISNAVTAVKDFIGGSSNVDMTYNGYDPMSGGAGYTTNIYANTSLDAAQMADVVNTANQKLAYDIGM